MNVKKYYSNAEIMTNLINAMRFRNNAFLNVIENKKYNLQNVVVSEPGHLLKNMDRFNFHERSYNLYTSVARYDYAKMNKDLSFPPFSYNLAKRKEQGLLFNDIANKYMLAYDFVLDFDAHDDFETCFEEVQIIKNQFDFFKVPYILRFSGRGFHMIIPHKFLPEREDIVKFLKESAMVLKQIYNLSSLDLGIYDSRRVIKTPYSFDYRSGFVCLPLTDKEFEHFNPEFCSPESVLIIPQLYVRGSLLRNGTKDNFVEFLKRRLDINVA